MFLLGNMNIILLVNSARQKHRAKAKRSNKTKYGDDNHHCIGSTLVTQKSNNRDDG